MVDATEGILLWELKPNNCPWPSGGPRDPIEFFCGKPTIEGCSWCADHYKRVFNKRSAQSKQKELKQAFG